MTAEKRPNQALPKTAVAFAPDPMAPTVCAIVFRVKMAANDRSTFSCFCRFSRAASLGRSFLSPAINEGVMLSRTASATEQRNEKTNASRT